MVENASVRYCPSLERFKDAQIRSISALRESYCPFWSIETSVLDIPFPDPYLKRYGYPYLRTYGSIHKNNLRGREDSIHQQTAGNDQKYRNVFRHNRI